MPPDLPAFFTSSSWAQRSHAKTRLIAIYLPMYALLVAANASFQAHSSMTYLSKSSRVKYISLSMVISSRRIVRPAICGDRSRTGTVGVEQPPAFPGRPVGFLNDVLGVVLVAHHAEGHAVQGRSMLVNQSVEICLR